MRSDRDALVVEVDHLTGHRAAADAENAAATDRLCRVEKSSASRIGFHCGTTLNIVPSEIRSVRAAIQVEISRPLGMTS